jgi:hypothetical protein
MKVAFPSESSADEAAVLVLVEGLLGVQIERVSIPAPRTRGWKGVLNAAEPTMQYLHYRTDAEALVITLDSDESPIHRIGAVSGLCDSKCRLCQLMVSVGNVQNSVRSRHGRGHVRVALGLAIPAIEAWCLCGTDPHLTESSWVQSLPLNKFPYSKKDLKQRLYGCTDPVLELETKCLADQAKQLVDGGRLTDLERLFPTGFGPLANEVRRWVS